jgi:predicted short-subunit dehydrogenase-like oxidoreductase (DUF2520 family)
MKHISIIGLGKVGSHLRYALRKTGKYKIHINAINKSEIIFITTQDSKIRSAVQILSSQKVNLKKKYVYHTSGVLTSDILLPLKKRGAEIGSFHPVQTFENKPARKKSVPRFKNIYTVVEGSKKAVSKASQIARDLGSYPVTIDKKNKILHHIYSVMASNYIISLVYAMDNLGKRIRKNGFNKRGFFSIYEPLILQTLENIKSKGAVKSLTGPVERNDLQALNLHLKELRGKFPKLLPLYKILAKETAKVALIKGSINKKELNKLLRILN